MMLQDKSNTPSSSDHQAQSKQDQSYSPTDKKHITNDGNPIQRRRRTKKNSGESREYKCACGKSYLSYPALYTHTKQKHNGKSQGPIKKSSLTLSEDNAKPDSESDSQPSVPQNPETSTILNQLIMKLPQDESNQKNIGLKDVYDLISWENQLDLSEAITCGRRLIISSYYNSLLSHYPVENVQVVTINEDMNANSAFINFVKEIKEYASFEQMKIIFLFIYVFRKMINERGINRQTILQGQDGLHEECENIKTTQLVENANIFMSQQLPKILKKIEERLSIRNYIIGIVKDSNVETYMISIMISFCDWLYAKNLTDDKIILKGELSD